MVCIDSGDPEYLQTYLAQGQSPTSSVFQQGYTAVLTSVMPSFTCPNNMSIVTGVPSSQHGISGNFYLDNHTWGR
ncbi:alkaline phosphatase family protein [Sodalis-like endosymbiont of Proechinophthirus fluctus]|uniref:alkaline phosphatase family protein n=1 Tax=Sodalis-like endosymbiont of Proechinophthirus fluctus TaxID=1462730 RepID=UPI00093C65C1